MDCWDAPRTTDVREAYEKTVHCYQLSMRMLKLATYVVLNIGVLLTALVSKGALLLMTNSVAKVQEVMKDKLFTLSRHAAQETYTDRMEKKMALRGIRVMPLLLLGYLDLSSASRCIITNANTDRVEM